MFGQQSSSLSSTYMIEINISLRKIEDDSYKIVIGENILESIAPDMKQADLAYNYAIITDSNVHKLYGESLKKHFSDLGLNNILLTFPAGEKNKNRQTKSKLEDEMLNNKFGRDSAVIAIGGGVVGDVAGYLAATYNRGVKYVQVPTSLVACVDSSIGGKTGVDTHHGKNLIGSFHQPYRVYIDTNTLKTLPRKEVREGLAEVIKYGVIKDGNLFRYLEKNTEKIFIHDEQALRYIVKTSCEIKGEVVENDEKEFNLRKILNFGHTVGHGIEALSDFKITHGEAISIGMIAEGKIAIKLGLWNHDELTRLRNLIRSASLPTDIPQNTGIGKLIDVMKLDKKARGGEIEMTLPIKIGEMSSLNGNYGIKVDENFIYKTI